MLAAAERLIERDGLAALSLRAVCADAGTTTRAVYALFGSKDGLVVALGAMAYELLGTAVAALPRTDDPAADLVEAGLAFRRFAREHPALFALAVQRALPSDALWHQFRSSAGRALLTLRERLERLTQEDGLGGRSITEAAWQFHALCEGLAATELRDRSSGPLAEQRWRAALRALVHGFAAAPVDAEPLTSAKPPSPRA